MSLGDYATNLKLDNDGTLAAHNVENPRGESALHTVVAVLSLALVTVVLRIVTRLFVVRNAGPDDIAIVVAWIFALAMTMAMVFQVHFGLGLHQTSLTDADTVGLLKSFWASIWLYHLSLFCTKVALLLQYLRIFTSPWFRRAAYTIFGFVIFASCWTVFGSMFSCIPVEASWDASVKGKCLSHALTWYFNAGLNVFTDTMIIILPMPVLKKLNMPLKQRIALMGVFALGFFVCIISFIRISELREIAKSTDISYTNVSASTWSAVEVDVGIICACLPSLKATVTRFFPRLFSSAHSNALSGNALSGGVAGNGYFSSSKRNAYGNGTSHSQIDNRSRIGHYSKEGSGPQGIGLPTYHTTISAKPLKHSKSQVNSEYDVEMGHLHNHAARGVRGGPGSQGPSEGKIDVVTVLEQEVEHRGSSTHSPVDSGSGNGVTTVGGSASSIKSEGSESELFPPPGESYYIDAGNRRNGSGGHGPTHGTYGYAR